MQKHSFYSGNMFGCKKQQAKGTLPAEGAHLIMLCSMDLVVHHKVKNLLYIIFLVCYNLHLRNIAVGKDVC